MGGVAPEPGAGGDPPASSAVTVVFRRGAVRRTPRASAAMIALLVSYSLADTTPSVNRFAAAVKIQTAAYRETTTAGRRPRGDRPVCGACITTQAAGHIPVTRSANTVPVWGLTEVTCVLASAVPACLSNALRAVERLCPALR